MIFVIVSAKKEAAQKYTILPTLAKQQLQERFMILKRAKNKYTRVKKEKEMAEVFKRKSGPLKKEKARINQKKEWQDEWERERDEVC
jgi:hypothetical protein